MEPPEDFARGADRQSRFAFKPRLHVGEIVAVYLAVQGVRQALVDDQLGILEMLMLRPACDDPTLSRIIQNPELIVGSSHAGRSMSISST